MRVTLLLLLLLSGHLQARDAGLTPVFFQKNRADLRERMPENSVAILCSAPLQVQSNDIYYPYKQDPDFYYLTGNLDPHGMLILFSEPRRIQGQLLSEMLFIPGKNKFMTYWDGGYAAEDEVKASSGVEVVRVSKSFPELKLDFKQFSQVFMKNSGAFVQDDTRDRGDLSSLLKHLKLKLGDVEVEQSSLSLWLGELRQMKTKEEIQKLMLVSKQTCVALKRTVQTVRPGVPEYKVRSFLTYQMLNQGMDRLAFPPICGSGPNSCILHYKGKERVLSSGDVLVIDVGGDLDGYVSDVTRTVPVSGRFTDVQAELYDVVLKAYKAALDRCRKGKRFWEPHQAASKVIGEALVELGIIAHAGLVSQYFTHSTAHYVGLDVHDLGTYEVLKPGQVLAIEPGVYIPKGSPCDSKWWDIGIRIEDVVRITRGDPVVLSSDMPVERAAVEALMKP